MAGEVTRAEARLQELFEAAHRDRNLKMRLLSDPEVVAKEWGVELGAAEAARLRKVGAFAELADEAKHGTLFRVCDPKVCYPSTLWLQQEVLSLIEIFKPPIDPIGYPIDFMRRFGGLSRISERFVR
jgi:hypothetical protein